MNTLQLVRFHDKLIREDLIPNYIEDFLLLHDPRVAKAFINKETGK